MRGDRTTGYWGFSAINIKEIIIRLIEILFQCLEVRYNWVVLWVVIGKMVEDGTNQFDLWGPSAIIRQIIIGLIDLIYGCV